MSRVLVTGASGHLGAHITRRLLAKGHEVVAFIRSTSDLRGLRGLDLSYRYGDVLDEPSLVEAMQGCEVVIHAAAIYQFWSKNPQQMIQTAVLGTRNLFLAAEKAGVQRIVYTSTTFAVGPTKDPDRIRTPEDWNTDLHLPYAISKTRAEQEAWRLAAETGIKLLSLCPCGILGDLDYHITPTTEILLALINGSGATSKGGTSFVDVRDVAEIHAQAVDSGVPSGRYIIAGEMMTLQRFGEIVSELTGVRVRHIDAPRNVMLVIAGMMELIAGILRKKPLLTRDMVLELVGRYHYFDCEKTWQTFGLTPRSSGLMISNAIQWLLYSGQIKPELADQLMANLESVSITKSLAI